MITRTRCLAMSELPAEQRAASGDISAVPTDADTPQFQYVEEFVRYQLCQSLGGPRGMIESAVPFIGFTVAWVASRGSSIWPSASPSALP